VLVALALLTTSALAARLQDPPPSLELRVERAIARGVERLRKLQRSDGSWAGHEDQHPGGVTSLVGYTLARSGVKSSDPCLRNALASLGKTEFESTYSHGVHLLMLEALGEPDAWRGRARASVAFLVEHQSEGVWAYPWGALDMSNTQFALLGLLAAHRMGLEIPEETVESALCGLWRWQSECGAFCYAGDFPVTAGMTAATLAGLAVLDELSAGSSKLQSLLAKRATDRERAERWLAEHFEVARNHYGPRAWTPSWRHAYLWAVERYCGLARHAEIGGRDWYAEGAELLALEQTLDGTWGRNIEDTCFALLFLRRATVSTGGDARDLFARIDRDKVRSYEPELVPVAGLQRLTDWLVAGPWPGGPGNVVLLEPPFDPRQAKPKEKLKLAGRRWTRRTLKADGWTNLDQLTKHDGDRQLWALATTIVVEPGELGVAEALCAILWLELEDGWDVYLDGERVSFELREAAPLPNEVPIELSLAPGEHTLLVLCEDDTGSAVFGARVSDARGDRLEPPLAIHAAPAKAAKRR